MDSPGPTGMGGLIRNIEANILCSFSGDAGFESINMAELKALCIGLREAHRMHLRCIMVEEDSLCAVRWASGRCYAPWAIVEEVRDLCKDFEISFVHVKRAANGAADSLVKERMGHQNLYTEIQASIGISVLYFFHLVKAALAPILDKSSPSL